MRIAIYTYFAPLFGRLCHSWARQLQARGHDVRVFEQPHKREPDPLPAVDAELHLVVCGVFLLWALERHGFPATGRTVAWLCEPLIDDPESRHHFKARAFDAVSGGFAAIACMDAHIEAAVRRRLPDLPVTRIPFMIDPADIRVPPADCDQSIDALQLGRRSRYREEAERQLRAAGLEPTFIYDGRYDEGRHDLIRSARLSLNIQADENRYFNQHRVFEAWAAGSVVVSEPTDDMADYGVADGAQLVTADLDAMPEACRELLGDLARRQRLTSAAQALLRDRFATDRWAEALLKFIDMAPNRR